MENPEPSKINIDTTTIHGVDPNGPRPLTPVLKPKDKKFKK